MKNICQQLLSLNNVLKPRVRQNDRICMEFVGQNSKDPDIQFVMPGSLLDPGFLKSGFNCIFIKEDLIRHFNVFVVETTILISPSIF